MDLELNIEKLYGDVIRRKRRVIGWGTGSVFKDFYGRLPVDHEYLIDNNPEVNGLLINDLEISDPERLKAEDPEEVVVIIYSSFVDQISEQVRSMGSFPVVAASALADFDQMQSGFLKMQRRYAHERN